MLVVPEQPLDFRKFRNLMAQRFGIPAAQRLAAAPTFGRQARNDLLTLLAGNQGAFVLGMIGLAATLAP